MFYQRVTRARICPHQRQLFSVSLRIEIRGMDLCICTVSAERFSFVLLCTILSLRGRTVWIKCKFRESVCGVWGILGSRTRRDRVARGETSGAIDELVLAAHFSLIRIRLRERVGSRASSVEFIDPLATTKSSATFLFLSVSYRCTENLQFHLNFPSASFCR